MNHEGKLVAALAAVMLALPVAAQTGGAAAPTVKDEKMVADMVTVTAKVEAVDQAKRTISLKGPLGRTLTLKVGSEARNFPQVKVGDVFVVKYAEAVSIKLEKGAAGRSETQTVAAARTPAGAMPGGAVVEQIVVVANVERIDAAKSSILLEGPNANYVEVKVKDPAVMKDVKVNDKVVVTYTEAIVVDLQTPPKK